MLKASELINAANVEFAKKEIKVVAVDGKEYLVLMDAKFRKTKLVKLTVDMVERAKYCKTNNVEFDYSICLFAMIVKHFTDIKFMEYKDMGKKYQNEMSTINALIDLEIIEQIMAKIDASEMEKLTNLSKDFSTFSKYMYQVNLDQEIENIIDNAEYIIDDTESDNENGEV